jgi:hypothetical protein
VNDELFSWCPLFEKKRGTSTPPHLFCRVNYGNPKEMVEVLGLLPDKTKVVEYYRASDK